MKDEKNFILTADLPRVIWALSWPSVLAMVLYGLNSFLDGVFVGRLMDQTALAGVGIAYPLTQIMLGLGSLVGTGAGTALSVWIGANDQKKIKKMLGTANGLSILLAALISVPLYFFAEPLLQLMGADGEVLSYGSTYFRITTIGSVFWIHGLALNMIVRGEGRMKTAAWMIAVGLIVDVLLKPVFIDTFGWGVQGAAWATNIGMMVYSVIGLWYFARKKSSFESNWNSMRIDKAVATQICKLGLPGMILSVMSVLQSAVVLHAITRYGVPDDLAFYTVCNRILLFMMMPMIGLMRALQPVAGMNFGAGNYGRVIRSYWLFVLVGVLIIAPFWLIMTIYPDAVIHTMLPGIGIRNEQITDFRIYLGILPVLPVVFMCLVTLPSIGGAKQTSVIAMLRQVIFYFPLMIWAPRYFGVSAVYWGSTLIDVIVILITLYILQIAFKKMRVKNVQPVMDSSFTP